MVANFLYLQRHYAEYRMLRFLIAEGQKTSALLTPYSDLSRFAGLASAALMD